MADPQDADGSLRPHLTPDEVAQVRAWHERALDELRRDAPVTVPYLGRTFVVPADVFPPAPMSALLGRAVLAEVRAADRVLDMRTTARSGASWPRPAIGFGGAGASCCSSARRVTWPTCAT